MAISIPIISEFNGDGIDKAVKQFKQLETTGQKAQFALKKAAVPAAAAVAALTAVIGDSIKAATEDAEAQAMLARQLRASALASDATIAATEEFISKTSMAAAVSDDELRPALARIVTATGEVNEAQDLLSIALDVSAATGKDLASVSEAMAKGFAGNLKPLGALSPELKTLIKDGGDFSDVLRILDMNFKDAAETAANTTAGGMRRLAISIGEAKESLGAAFLPVLEAALPKLQAFADWAMENPALLKNVALGIAGIAGATLLVNAAMATNPYVLMAAGIGAVYLAFKKLSDWYANAPGPLKALLTAGNLIGTTIFQGFQGQFLTKVLQDLGLGGGGGGSQPRSRLAVPAMANGGIVTGPTLALIGEAGPEAVVPLDRMGGMGNVTINVNGGDPEAVVNALRRYMNRYGNIPIRTTAP